VRRIDALAAPLSPGRALDVECGEGADSLWLAQQGWRVTGVDITQSALSKS
jgi:2-polyprenyl-3-methyl-5-hydroxy-6-metoxy-1,4-benzoquinol methylase